MTAPTRYAAEERDPDAVGDDLVRLWSENLRSMGSGGPAKLDWYYRRGPAGPGRAIVLRAHGASGDFVVGCQGVGFRRFWRGDGVLRAALLADLAVDAPHRTLFPALALVRQARAVAERAADFQYGFPNQAATGLFRRAGFHVLGDVVRYARVLRFGPYLAAFVHVPPLASAAGAVLDAAHGVLHAASRMRAAARFRLELGAELDPRFDALFDEARRDHPLIADRGREFLRWRFLAGSVRAELATLVRRSDGALRGYAAVTRQGGVAHLSDFLAASGPELGALLTLLSPVLRARGCVSVSARFLGGARTVRILERHGFRRRNADRTIVLAGGREPLSATFTDVESFYLTDADEDE